MDSPRSGPYLLERPTHFASAVAAARTAWRHSPLGEPEGLFFSPGLRPEQQADPSALGPPSPKKQRRAPV